MTEGIEWPPQLLLVLRRHLEQVEHPEHPRTPPLATGAAQRSVLTFLADAREQVRQRCNTSESVLECCQSLVLDTIEECCASSFLSARERRVINLAAAQRERRSDGRPGPKRRRSDTEEAAAAKAATATPACSHKCAAVLPVEYLLRFFIALPSILVHYDKLGGCAMPAAYKQPLWDYVNAVLDIMKEITFVDTMSYVVLK
ncbi:uncharacterized protein TM35_000142960 [Trypanosoma theileri]|uniref:Uncharacterized protein n=1 Tax=Trypanosoma theileri TaxID=67003 RepID=A0A1X0NWK9_9TRYP|nr:uncharacterized protein TM35_000142960 [Trypanosoma theileri]ORC89085.1 hypothetical protein TM35_000142960 [Trypanosoma theileri]